MPCVRPSPWLSIHIFVVMSVRSTDYEQHEKPVFYYHFTVRNEIADAPHSFVLYNHRPESLN